MLLRKSIALQIVIFAFHTHISQSIELPKYISKDILKKKLMTAITMGGGILNG